MKRRVYTTDDRNNVLKLFNNGDNKLKISKETGIPYSILKKWVSSKNIKEAYSPITNFKKYLNNKIKQKAYSFILAVYLGDGYISTYKTFRAPKLCFSNDKKYIKNTQEWVEKLQILFPDNKVNIYPKRNGNCYMIQVYSKKILDLFPQHGIGKKHTRKIRLKTWQNNIVKKYPEEFIRGCIQSDGSIYEQTIKNYKYKNYCFVNKSKDITMLFILALSLKGINKSLYYNKARQLFVIQNFNKDQIKILNKIIPSKE
jgi:hypothetical protein